MDEKEVAASSAPHKRSKSVPAMSPAFLNDTQLQDQQIVGRSRSNTADSVERKVRTQRRGARLSSGGLLRNQSKKRRNKDALVKSRSVDVVDRDEKDNSSRKSSSNSSEPSEHEEERGLIRARKQGFCLPPVNTVLKKLKTMEDEKEFPNNIDSDQANSLVVCSTKEESFVGDQQMNSTEKLYDESKLSEDKPLDEPSHPPKLTDYGEKQEKNIQGQTFDFQESKINIRRKSLPADLSEYQINSNLGDCSGGHEYRTMLMSSNQTDMKFQNNYRIVCKERCQNKLWRRWQSLPESLYKVKEAADSRTKELVPASLGQEREIAVFAEPVEQDLSSIQDSSQHQEHENCTADSCNEKVEDKNMTADKLILEQQLSSNSKENLAPEDKMETTKRSNKIKRSFSLPVNFYIVDEDERQGNKTGELKRTKSLTTGDAFDEVFPVMLSEKTTKLEPDNDDLDDKLQKKNGGNGNEVVQKKTRRVRRRDRRRAKSLPVTLALEEIPEESPEQCQCYDEYESIQDMDKKHMNKAFQELLRKIQKSQRPRNKVKRTRSLSTIKEATASNETLHEVESRHKHEEVVTLEKADEKPEGQSTDHEQEHIDTTTHKHESERDEQHEIHDIQHEQNAGAAVEANVNVGSLSQEQEEEKDKVDLLQRLNGEDFVSTKEEEKDLQEENEKPQLSENAEDEMLVLQQELLHENNKAEELLMNKENDEQLDNTTQQSPVLNESLNEQVKEEEPNIHKAKEELHIDVPQIFVSEVECEESQLSAVDTYGADVYDDVDGCVEPEGSDEQCVSPQTEELKSPDDEDIQGTILEHINNIGFTFDNSINQRAIVNVPFMERIPEDPDKENVVELPETEIESTGAEWESNEDGFDSADATEEQSTLKRAGSMRTAKGSRGKNSIPSRKKFRPITGESNRDQKRVKWSDLSRDAAESEDNQENQGDGFQDEYEPGPSGDFTFTGSEDVSEHTTQDEFEKGPRGELSFTGEHGIPVDQSDYYESDEFDFEPPESKFDILVRNAVNSYLEPDYTKSDSPIHRAVALGSLDHLRELIDEGADVNAVDKHGWPPLHVATLFNKIDCAELLLEAGASLQDYTDSLIHEYKTLRETVC